MSPPPTAAAAASVNLSLSVMSKETCRSLNCARRHGKLEPEWAQLTFQPNIDWKAGGVRGDCVAGERSNDTFALLIVR